MKNLWLYILAFCTVLTSCEEEFIPDIDEDNQEIIVEGYIEKGENSLPPFVILSRSFPFFGQITAEDISALQIRDAEVLVSVAGETYPLQHICVSELPQSLRAQIFKELGVIDISEDVDFCLYIDLLRDIPIREDSIYRLNISLDNGENLEAKTRIPDHVAIDSFQFTRPPGDNQNDTMARLLITITDPPGPNFYRYMTAGEGESFRPGFASVTDDRLFDGKSFDFPLQKAVTPEELEELDPEIYGLYTRGDTVRIRWLNIDEDHYNFWNTFEFNLNNQGPFASYTRVNSNVPGAIGIWGGYSSTEYTLLVPEQ